MAAPVPATGRKLGTGAKLGLGFIGMVVVAAVYYFFFYSDLSSAIATQTQREGQLKSDANAADAAFGAFMKDSTELEKKKAKARDLNKVLPESNEIATFLAAVNQQAEVAGLKVKMVQPAEEQLQPFYTRVPVKIEVAGRYHQLAKFFAGVGRLDRIINVETIELSSPLTGDNDQTTLTARCLTTTFHTNAPKPAGAGSAAPGQPGAPPPPPPQGAPK
ncbi:MAG: type 4a pilus biogenesis protein PilO [Polyangiales bacterium]